MPRFSAPSATSIATLIVVGAIAAGCAGSGSAAPAASAAPVRSAGAAPVPAPTGPSFDLTVAKGPDGHVSAGVGTYTVDPTSSLNVCTHAADGSWRYLYGGGAPFVNIDLLVGAGAGTAGNSGKVALELTAGKGYLRFDPTQMRGGDEPGRSTATIAVTTGPSTTTFDITAVTPDKNLADDSAKVAVDLSVTCPN